MGSVIRGNSVSGDSSIEGLKEITAKLESIVMDVAEARDEVKDLLYDAGRMLRDEARTLAPYDPKRKRGKHLREGIFVSRGDPAKADVLVGVNYRIAPHAHLLEYGTAKRAARPYMRPAIAATGQKIAAHIKAGLLKILEKHR